jgi:lambda family phage portal protein
MRNPFRRRKAQAHRAPAPLKRAFDMGAINRLTADWTGDDLTINQMLFAQADIIRQRARDLGLNSPWARRFLAMARTNIVGPNGFTFNAQGVQGADTPDVRGNKEIERLWKDWQKPSTCTMSGNMSLIDVCNQSVTGLMQDGEFIIRMIPGAPNKFGFSLSLMPIDLLDQNHNRELRRDHLGNITQNAIKLGVEVDEWDRPVNYYFRDQVDSPIGCGYGGGTYRHKIFPADEIIHVFPSERPGQTRGFSFIAPAGTRAKMLNAFEDASVTHKRISASKMGLLEPDPENPPAHDYTADGENADGSRKMEVEPGIWEVIPLGYKAGKFDVEDVSDGFSDFSKQILRSIASAWNVNYNTLANDLSEVNYSSIRHGALEDRDAWMCIQRFIIEQVLDRIYAQWLKWTLTMGITFIAPGNYDRFMRYTFQGRRWQWVDPAKEEAANKLALASSTTSEFEIARRQGRDFEEIVAERKRARQLLNDAGFEAIGASVGEQV